MVKDLVTETERRLTSSIENSGEERGEWELEREEGIKTAGRGNATWIEDWEESTADFVSV